MKHLTEEHLAAYIGKGLTCKLHGSRKRYTLDGIRWGKAVLICRDGVTFYKTLHELILCVRPLSQFTMDDMRNMGCRGSLIYYVNKIKDGQLTYNEMQILLSQHWDVFGLIEAGFAEPIPSIPQP
jgi:hypothetical protein